MFRMLVAGLVALALPTAAFAGAVVESLKGSGQAGSAPLARGQRLEAPVAISTEAGAQVFLQFEDGMQIVLHENSLLRMIDYRHTDTGATDRAVFELLRGAARVVTGKIAKDNPKQFFFRTPQTQLMVERPADFTVALVNPAYITVNAGSVLSNNGWGTVTLNPGGAFAIASNASAPAAISASALPASASSAMSNLGLASVTTPLGGGAATGVAATAGGVAGVGFAGPMILIGAAVAGVAVAAGDDDTPSATTHH